MVDVVILDGIVSFVNIVQFGTIARYGAALGPSVSHIIPTSTLGIDTALLPGADGRVLGSVCLAASQRGAPHHGCANLDLSFGLPYNYARQDPRQSPWTLVKGGHGTRPSPAPRLDYRRAKEEQRHPQRVASG